MIRASEADLELHQRLRWYIRLRWYLLVAILLPILFSSTATFPKGQQLFYDVVITGGLLASNALFYVLTRVRRTPGYQRSIALTLLIVDVLFVTFFIYARGGVESRSQLLYTIPIIASTALFGGIAPYVMAAGSAFAFDLLILAEHFGVLHGRQPLVALHGTFHYVFNSAIFFSSILLIIGALADFITRLLVRQEREAQATAMALRRAQAVARVGSWELYPDTYRIVWSDELYNLFDVDPNIDGLNLTDEYMKRVHVEDRQPVRDCIETAIRKRKPFRFDFRITHRDGSQLILHSEGKVMVSQGKVIQLYGTSQDITAERALDAAKGDFVSLASHQLRTPAGGVRMLLTMLRDGYDGTLNPQQLATVEQAIESNERLLRIADDLLNVAKLEAGRLELNRQQIELCLWLRNIVAPQKLLAKERKQTVKLQLPKGTVFMSGDPDRMAMVLDNLLTNARKYTQPRGVITVTLSPGVRSHKIIVSDTGNGMSKGEIQKLFGKFTRIDNQASKGTEGTGLGLYLAKSIVDLHGGTINVVSKQGSGTTFTIRLPV